MEFTVGGYQSDSRPIAHYSPDGGRLSADEAAAYVADIRAVDAALVPLIAASAPTASYRDVTEAAIAVQGWEAERAQRVREYLAHRSEEQYGAAIGDLAAHGLDDDQIDGDEVVFPDGYDALAMGLARGLDIRLAHVVSRVRWGVEGVTVTTDRGEFTSRDVVVTVPVGVLQSASFTIEPPLPEPVAGALGRLRMNAFEKLFLRFPERFWDSDVYAIRQQGPEGRWWRSGAPRGRTTPTRAARTRTCVRGRRPTTTTPWPHRWPACCTWRARPRGPTIRRPSRQRCARGTVPRRTCSARTCRSSICGAPR